MPPENTNPVAKSEVSEFDFDKPQTANPRIRKRSLKVHPPASPTAEAKPEPVAGQLQPAVYAQPAAASSARGEPRPTYVRPSTGEPSAPAPSQPSGVLYYSNGPHKEASMKTTPLSQAARPAPTSASQPIPQRTAAAAAATAAQAPINRSATAPQAAASSHAHTPSHGAAGYGAAGHTTAGSSAARPAGSSTAASSASSAGASRTLSTTVAGPAPSSKPAGVSDYRSNIDRQSREQKSIGGILSIVVYSLIGLFVLGAALAAYGAHDVYRQLHSQSVTVSDLDSRYAAENQQLNDQLKVTEQSIIQLQDQMARSQELALRQQDAIAKLQTALDAETAALREERATRAAETSIRESETSALRTRIRNLEKNEITFHP